MLTGPDAERKQVFENLIRAMNKSKMATECSKALCERLEAQRKSGNVTMSQYYASSAKAIREYNEQCPSGKLQHNIEEHLKKYDSAEVKCRDKAPTHL